MTVCSQHRLKITEVLNLEKYKCPFCENEITSNQTQKNAFGKSFVLLALDTNNQKVTSNGIRVKAIECDKCHNIWLRNAEY